MVVSLRSRAGVHVAGSPDIGILIPIEWVFSIVITEVQVETQIFTSSGRIVSIGRRRIKALHESHGPSRHPFIRLGENVDIVIVNHINVELLDVRGLDIVKVGVVDAVSEIASSKGRPLPPHLLGSLGSQDGAHVADDGRPLAMVDECDGRPDLVTAALGGCAVDERRDRKEALEVNHSEDDWGFMASSDTGEVRGEMQGKKREISSEGKDARGIHGWVIQKLQATGDRHPLTAYPPRSGSNRAQVLCT